MTLAAATALAASGGILFQEDFSHYRDSAPGAAQGEVFKGLTTGRSWGCDIYDWPGYTALSFDGWSDVCQRTDANDYDLILTPGPSDEQWVSSTGGDKRITWPVRIRAVTVCVNRCKPTLLGVAPPAPTSVRLKRVWSAPAKADPLARRRASGGR